VVLEVSCPRIPCGTFQGWLAQEGWIKRFTAAAMPGAYLRVINPGEIRAGDVVTIEHRPGHDVTIALTFRALTTEPELLPRLQPADALPQDIKNRVRARTLRARTPGRSPSASPRLQLVVAVLLGHAGECLNRSAARHPPGARSGVKPAASGPRSTRTHRT
jgi:hypothetical protein